jgi:hypothetical protein
MSLAFSIAVPRPEGASRGNDIHGSPCGPIQLVAGAVAIGAPRAAAGAAVPDASPDASALRRCSCRFASARRPLRRLIMAQIATTSSATMPATGVSSAATSRPTAPAIVIVATSHQKPKPRSSRGRMSAPTNRRNELRLISHTGIRRAGRSGARNSLATQRMAPESFRRSQRNGARSQEPVRSPDPSWPESLRVRRAAPGRCASDTSGRSAVCVAALSTLVSYPLLTSCRLWVPGR